MIIKVSTAFPAWPLVRQTPESKGWWRDCRFVINQPIKMCDFWIVFEDFPQPETAVCPPEHILLVTGEPPAVKSYSSPFLEQFAKIITCHELDSRFSVIRRQQALPWMVGWAVRGGVTLGYCKNYDELKRMTGIKKDKVLSVIASDKSFTEGHRNRRYFVQELQRAMGDELDVFGRGIREIEDKWEGIAPYKYHIVIENSRVRDYWTEKLSDCFLAGAYPLYYGCPNLSDYFVPDSFSFIDIDQIEMAVQIIKTAINNDLYGNSLCQLQRARERILDEYNFFPMIYQLCTLDTTGSRAVSVTLLPQDWIQKQ